MIISRRVTVIVLMVTALAISGLVLAADKGPSAPAKKDSSSPEANAQAPQAAGQPVSAVTQQAVNMGVLSSAGKINQVVNFFTANNQSGAFIFPVYQPPDLHIFSASLEVVRPDASMFYASASFAPNQDVVYDTVEYVNRSCQEMEQEVFKGLKRIGVVKKDIVLLDGGALKIFLMPAGRGCVVIKKEVVQ